MKVALVTPWENAWVPYYKAAVEARGHEFVSAAKVYQVRGADVVLHGWTGQGAAVPGARNIVFLRRYELFDGGISRTDWKNVDALICVNTWIADVAKRSLRAKGLQTPVHMIYNGTDPSRWAFKDRKPNNKVGMACHVHPKKNLPLALQIMALLPENYELHIAGQIQDACTAEYLNHVGKAMRRPVYLYDHVPAEQLNFWWEQMGVCLSTSLSEGNPNNVIEAMAKGIKPVVHNWPGAKDQFDSVFETAAQAAEMILDQHYASNEYLATVQQKFSLSNIERVLDIALTTEDQCAA
jgi:glycosyltransferase involved in cell wall biosynthesis